MNNSDSWINDLLPRQTKSLKCLKVFGFEFNRDVMEQFVISCVPLETLQLDLEALNLSLLQAIKDHESERLKWSELIVEDFDKIYQDLVNLIIANHPEIKTLTFKIGSESAMSFPVFLRVVKFKFSPYDKPGFDDFTKVHALYFSEVLTTQLDEFCDFLNRCPNLKILMMTKAQKFLTPEIIEIILNTAQNLEVIQIGELVANNGRGDDITAKLNAIKTHGKKLRTLNLVPTFQDELKIEKLREESKIFNDTAVQVFVRSYRDSLSFEFDKNCITWKK